MKHLDDVRSRVLLAALIPSAGLVLAGLVVTGLLVRQGVQAREFADRAGATTTSVTALVTDVLQERRLTDIGHPRADPDRDGQVDDAIADLQRTARDAPDAEVGYEQLTAAQLLAAIDGMSRTDALAAAGATLTPDERRSFVGAVGTYRANLAAAAPKLSARGRELYAALVQGEDWSRLTAATDALVAGDRPPFAEAEWRASAREVADQLAALGKQQSTYATQLAADSGRRTLAGALAGGAAMLILAVLTFSIAIGVSRRGGKATVATHVEDGPVVAALPYPRLPRGRVPPRPGIAPQMPELWVMEAVLRGLRKL